MLKAMEADSGIKLSALKVDGGASANNFLMQFQSDILNTEVRRPDALRQLQWERLILQDLQLDTGKIKMTLSITGILTVNSIQKCRKQKEKKN